MKRKIEPEAINSVHGTINYLSDLTFMAKKNRDKPTEAEDTVWEKILRYEKTGFKFSRQKPINRFILDFYCSKLCLAIEIDGGSHNLKKQNDKLRDKFLSQIGIQTIRFTNEDVENNLDLVKQKITKVCNSLACQGEVARCKSGRSG